jgi:predicted CxxxxCH...CXXCH cytochrome family protein
VFAALLLILAGCDDTIFPNGGGTIVTPEEGWCGVRSVIDASCTSCHGGSSPLGSLDLSGDAWTALVGVASAGTPAWTLVVAGDPDNSLFYQKMAGTQPADGGGVMPPTGALSAETLDVVRQWITDGASDVCEDPRDTGSSGRFHPDNWALPEEHGRGARQQELTCVTCHGEDLTGGNVGVSCDSCHDGGTAWRTNCTFCHGGTDNSTGAPPRDIDDSTTDISYAAHTAHVTEGNHAAYDCVQCHSKPSDVLSMGHLFLGDSTPGAAEVNFSAGLSNVGTYGGLGTCANLYCHGSAGRDNGSATDGATMTCTSCHPDQTSSESSWDSNMSGEHEKHLDEGARCSDCHSTVVTTSMVFVDATLHADGSPDVVPTAVTWNGASCTGTCHLGEETEEHENNRWD